MKRSEMIKILTGRFTNKDRHYEVPVELAELILNTVESAGIMPPCLPDDQCQELMKKYVDPSFNKWEPEDET